MKNKNFEIDNLIDQWAEEIDNDDFVEPENMDEILDKYKQQQKWSAVFGRIYIGSLVVCGISTLPVVPNFTGKIIMLLIIGIVVGFTIKYEKYKKLLQQQNPAVTVTDFVEQKKKLTAQFYHTMKMWRYCIYPLSIAMMVNNIIISFERFHGVGLAVALIFSVGVSAAMIRYIENGIREFREKLKAFS